VGLDRATAPSYGAQPVPKWLLPFPPNRYGPIERGLDRTAFAKLTKGFLCFVFELFE
jgi:hypothetical protein